MLQLAATNLMDELHLPDPTLFALPHRESFSGPAWLLPPPQEIQPFTWTESPRFLALQADQLGADLPPPNAAQLLERWPLTADFEPDLQMPAEVIGRIFPDRSRARVTGGLESRSLRTHLELSPKAHTEILSNSVVQLVVDREGVPVSAALIASSGFQEADEDAVRQARATRFDPLDRVVEANRPLSGLAWGELVFEWHTVPATNPSITKP
jgi:hypothetical protein